MGYLRIIDLTSCVLIAGIAVVFAVRNSAPVATSVTTSSAVGPAVSTTVEPRIFANAGFTYEHDLFRTKWEWAAYDQVQKILREETSA